MKQRETIWRRQRNVEVSFYQRTWHLSYVASAIPFVGGHLRRHGPLKMGWHFMGQLGKDETRSSVWRNYTLISCPFLGQFKSRSWIFPLWLSFPEANNIFVVQTNSDWTPIFIFTDFSCYDILWRETDDMIRSTLAYWWRRYLKTAINLLRTKTIHVWSADLKKRTTSDYVCGNIQIIETMT